MIRNPLRIGLVVFAASVAIAVLPAAAQRQQAEPEGSSGWFVQTLATAKHQMISTANGHASAAGREILRAGGNALDAAIAAQLVLGLVEPQSSGLGGGAFILNWNKFKQELKAYDGREAAPFTAKPDRFLRDGKPMPFETVVNSGLSVGTPGLVKLLWQTHQAHGKLPWETLFQPAVTLAENGFAVSRRLHVLLRLNGRQKFDAAAQKYFFDDAGTAWPVGHILKNPAYAETLKRIASRGPDAFYSGSVADSMVAAVKTAPNAAGDLQLDDLAEYQSLERAPLCLPYRTYKVCGMSPPSSGGVAIAQILQLLEPFDLGEDPNAALNGRAVHLILEAQKLAYADRDRYLADPGFVKVPPTLTDAAYLAERRKLMSDATAMAKPQPGEPPGADQRAFGEDATVERAGTSHISVIDGDGNAVSMTTTIEGAFGSGLMASGFLLNNELTDFSWRPEDKEGRPAANRIEGGKRPRSTMAPTIVFDQSGKVVAVVGSPGGSRIIFYVVKSLISLMDWKLDAQAAAALTNFGSMGDGAEVEYEWRSIMLALRLKSYGHEITADLMNSGLNIITANDDGLQGGTDPRREGAALGD
jgi:gamma-glutamyltranspeptidase / glutathione hydrolase